ncbi:MAG: hypothetical protein ISS74_06325 [Planctomycetes bacterium]|nr:hypothetical protein [Planctomycetota bacterium]
MKPKSILGIVLLVFAAGSIGYLVANEVRSGGEATTDPSAAAAADAALPADGVVVTYFYGGKRCPTCISIEAYAGEAVSQGFPAEVAAGRVVWRAVDTDRDENQHFVEHYDLFAKKLIIARRVGGEETTWESLDEIWTRVGDKDDFLAYVRGAVVEYLEKS